VSDQVILHVNLFGGVALVIFVYSRDVIHCYTLTTPCLEVTTTGKPSKPGGGRGKMHVQGPDWLVKIVTGVMLAYFEV